MTPDEARSFLATKRAGVGRPPREWSAKKKLAKQVLMEERLRETRLQKVASTVRLCPKHGAYDLNDGFCNGCNAEAEAAEQAAISPPVESKPEIKPDDSISKALEGLTTSTIDW